MAVVNLAVNKIFVFGEDNRLEIRSEFFNLFNSAFFEARNQTTDVTNPDFGRILQGSNPRNIQFGLRVVF